MVVAVYARVSTSEQSPDAQLLELREYVARRGFTVYREYVDTVSGSDTRRAKDAPGYQEMMRDAARRRFDGVVVWKFDRFARSIRGLIEGLHTFEALGIEFISMTQNIDTTTPGGKLLFYVIGVFAEFERDLIVERVRSGIAKAKAEGRIFGRPRDPLMEVRVRGLQAEGMSIRKIAKQTGRSRAGVSLILKRAYNQEQV